MTVPERWRIGGAGSGGCEVRFWIASLALHANACIRTTRARNDGVARIIGGLAALTQPTRYFLLSTVEGGLAFPV